MPRPTNPGLLQTGPGKIDPGTNNLVLIGAGMAGPPPNVGLPGFTTLSGTMLGWPSGLTTGSLTEHLEDPKGAHQASAISIDGKPALLYSTNVEAAIDEIMGAIAPEPPKLGQWVAHMASFFTGIPDWGSLRLTDGPPSYQAPPGGSVTGSDVYPIYWTAPTPTTDRRSTGLVSLAGEDPLTDPIWNHHSSVLGTFGGTKAGGYTDVNTGEVVRTRLVPAYPVFPWATLDVVPSFCLSGSLYPADKGVLALLHFPDPQAGLLFLDQSLTDRCWSALLLGQGLDTTSFGTSTPGGLTCDGGSGGIFSPGLDSQGSYDPFAFPGRASGQWDLNEIHTGLSVVDGAPLPAPWTAGAQRIQNDIVPGPGQVRLGTVAAAGEADPTGYGIPILGATTAAYNPPLPVDANIGEALLGNAVVTSSNFFRYRLPYLSDYSPLTGLKYTPSGENRRLTRETARYFDVTSTPSNTNNAWTEQVDGTWFLKTAGNYSGFDQDYWTWQLGRYRQIHYLSTAIGSSVRMGTLLLIHFKSEGDFEKCVRDGIMPWDVVAGYPVYGVTATVDPLIGSYNNVVNREVGAAPIPAAPDYGYTGTPYHSLRSALYVADDTTAPTTIAGHHWSLASVAPALDYVCVSGVSYAIPRYRATNVANVAIDSLYASFQDAWQEGYRVDDAALLNGMAPAQVSSPNPVFISWAHFKYEATPLAANFPAAFTSSLGYREQRVEFPLPYAGVDAGNALYSELNGPAGGEFLTVSTEGPAPLPVGNVTFPGDSLYPSFSSDAAPRVFVRRPHLTNPLQPSTATGWGQKLDYTGPLEKVLFHSTGFYHSAPGDGGVFGNFLTGGVAYPVLLTAEKDFKERFLDEVYRVKSNFPGVVDPVAQAHLQGPGMSGWVFAPMPVPVRMGDTGYTADATWANSSWLQLGEHHNNLAISTELQVAGLPDRNPPPENGVKVPFPSAGLLQYPKTDYTAIYWPTSADLQPGDTQPDYTTSTGWHFYTRCFDVAHVRSANPWNCIGQSTVAIRVDGLTLEDFQYVAPGPGSLTVANVGIAIQVKVPGQSTWMDLGRRDGDGPSKQDASLDGAGCQVVGTQTFTGVDPDTGIVFSQVLVHLGPWATLAQGYSAGGGLFEVPLLLRVWMDSAAADYDMQKKNLGPGSFFGAADPSVWSHRVRGITGLQVLHPDDVLEPSAAQLTEWAAYLEPLAGPGA